MWLVRTFACENVALVFVEAPPNGRALDTINLNRALSNAALIFYLFTARRTHKSSASIAVATAKVLRSADSALLSLFCTLLP